MEHPFINTHSFSYDSNNSVAQLTQNVEIEVYLERLCCFKTILLQPLFCNFNNHHIKDEEEADFDFDEEGTEAPEDSYDPSELEQLVVGEKCQAVLPSDGLVRHTWFSIPKQFTCLLKLCQCF